MTVSSTVRTTVDPRLANTLWQWLALGVVALLAWPAARGHGALLGWAPYWLVVAPAIGLAMAYRHRLFGRAVETHVEEATTAHRRRPRTPRLQAQRAPVARRARRLRVA